jgi:ABC-type multidrug transport system fused ATPase/permease subunit
MVRNKAVAAAYENVVFGYMKGRPVLKGINLHIPADKKIALVGLLKSSR